MNSGAEAVETAIKAARKWAHTVKGVPEDGGEILVFAGNFHGRTTTIVGFSSEEQYRKGFGPFTPGFRLLPYGDAEAVERAITPETVAVLVEPIQGEGGIVEPAGRLPAQAARAGERQPVPARRRRDPVGPRPHRQALLLRARGHPARHRRDRQGARRRLRADLRHPRR